MIKTSWNNYDFSYRSLTLSLTLSPRLSEILCYDYIGNIWCSCKYHSTGIAFTGLDEDGPRRGCRGNCMLFNDFNLYSLKFLFSGLVLISSRSLISWWCAYLIRAISASKRSEWWLHHSVSGPLPCPAGAACAVLVSQPLVSWQPSSLLQNKC